MSDNKNLTLQDIILWIVNNSDDRLAMDKINTLTFPYTTKYSNWQKMSGE